MQNDVIWVKSSVKYIHMST